MDAIVRSWIVQILEEHLSLIAIALRQRAKFEGWLKFELASMAERHGAQDVEVEASPVRGSSLSKSDLALRFKGIRYDIELKTSNSNWRMPGVLNRTRPITLNIAGIVRDAKKLRETSENGLVAFVLFPIPPRDRRWLEYLERIANELSIPLREEDHSSRLRITLGVGNEADLIVATFPVSGSFNDRAQVSLGN